MTVAINAAAAWVAQVVFQVASTAGASIQTAATIANIAYTAFQIGAQLAITVGLNAIARGSLPDPESGKIARRQSRPVRTYAMGDASRFSGATMFRETSNEHYGCVLALNDGRLDGIDAIYLNDDLVTLDGSGWVQGLADGRYGGGDLVQIHTRLGLPTETWYSAMADKFAAFWTADHRGDGIASLMVLAKHRSRESFSKHFPNGEVIPSVVAPGVCFDWRDPAQDREDESTWAQCSNPIVWLVHFEWFRMGRSWARSIAPVLDALTDEADYCDALVARKDASTEKRYRFGGWFPLDTEPQVVRESVLAACDGWMTTDGRGRLVIKAGRYVAPTFTLTAAHILGYTWRRGQAAEETVNKLLVSFVDPAKDFTDVECDPWVDEASITAIGIERPESLQLSWVHSLSQARRLAKRKMSRLGASRRGQIVADLDALNALGHRYIGVQNPEMASMADIVVEVMQIEGDLGSGTVTLDVILADANIDAWNPATEEGAAVAAIDRPALEALPAPTIDIVSAFAEDVGGASGIRLEIEGGGPDREDLTWFARWRVSGETSWSESQHTDLAAGAAVVLVTGFVPADAVLEVQIAYLTGGGTLSSWGPATPETVDTSTAALPPAMPTGLSAVDNGTTPDGATVQWNNGSDVTHAVVYIGGAADSFPGTGNSGDLTATPGTTQSHNYLASAGSYRIWVTNKNAAGESDPAGPVAVTVV